MSKNVDIQCYSGNLISQMDHALMELNLSYEEIYYNARNIAALSRQIKIMNNDFHCTLPFCHTLEAEGMGAVIRRSNKSVPMCSEYRYSHMDSLKDLKNIDFSSGRIGSVIEACKILKRDSEAVLLEISGPMTILNSLIKLNDVFRVWKKDKSVVLSILANIEEELLKYVSHIKNNVDIISYADPIASLDIIGPRMAEEWMKSFTVPFINKLLDLSNNDSIIHVCPKTSSVLTKFNFADWNNVLIDKPLSFVQACIENRNRISITGECCIKNRDFILNNGFIKELVLRT